jgi:hypothetical protein
MQGVLAARKQSLLMHPVCKMQDVCIRCILLHTWHDGAETCSLDDGCSLDVDQLHVATVAPPATVELEASLEGHCCGLDQHLGCPWCLELQGEWPKGYNGGLLDVVQVVVELHPCLNTAATPISCVDEWQHSMLAEQRDVLV